MKSLFDSATVELACPKCGHKFSERLGKLKTNPVIPCAACGTEITIQADSPNGLAPALKQADNSLAELERAVRSLGK